MLYYSIIILMFKIKKYKLNKTFIFSYIFINLFFILVFTIPASAVFLDPAASAYICNNTDKLCPTNQYCDTTCKEKKTATEFCNSSTECISNQCIKNYCIDTTKTTPTAASTKEDPWKATVPNLQIEIPTIQPFTGAGVTKDASGNILLPFFGQYVSGLYIWALSAAGLVCVALIIIGGFMYITSSGSADKITSAKEQITHALLGLGLLLLTYTILYLINPNLVQFSYLKLTVIERNPMDDAVFMGDEKYASTGSPKPYGSTDYDNLFKSYSQCNGINWQIFKAISFIESGLNPDNQKNTKSSYKGLLAIGEKYCTTNLSQVGWADKCNSPGIFDPEVNTAVASIMFKSQTNTIKKRCPNASFNDKMFMFYYSHSDGNCTLNHAITTFKTCEASTWPDGTWAADDTACLGQLKNKPIFGNAHFGAPRSNIMKTVNRVASFGITELNVPFNKSLCPYNKK